MKIVRAMKKVTRLQGEIKVLKKRVASSLNTVAENETFNESYIELTLLNEKIKKLVELKTRIMHTNVQHNMFHVILNLGELKSYIDYARELEPKHRMIKEGYGYDKEMTKFKSQLTVAERNKTVDECQELINKLTDELDDFNAKTDLVEMDVIVQTIV